MHGKQESLKRCGFADPYDKKQEMNLKRQSYKWVVNADASLPRREMEPVDVNLSLVSLGESLTPSVRTGNSTPGMFPVLP